MIDIQGLYSTLLTAQFGGQAFYVVDTSEEVGRRTLRFLFPGVDEATAQDLGADDGPVMLKGILGGDDYIAQARAMKAIWRSPGPYTLNHPWLGRLQVVFWPQTRPKMSLTANELKIARFEMQLMVLAAPTATGLLDTISNLEVQAGNLLADAQNWMANAIAPAVGVLGAFSFVQGFITQVGTAFGAVVGITMSAAEIIPATAEAIAALASPTTAPNPGYGAAAAVLLAAVPAALAAACAPLVPSAVAPGGVATALAAADPGDTVTTLLAVLPALTALGNAPAPAPAIASAMVALTVGNAVLASAAINYASQQDAQAEAALLYVAIDNAAAAVAIAAQSDPANAAPVWRDLIGLKAALAADLNTLIGRLPPVVSITVPRAVPAWVLAHYISGDDGSQVVATYQDIIARNNVFNPALVGPGKVEVLDV